MKVVALISGGKDSCYNMMQCVVEGHDIVALANLRPKHKDELDSYMFQTVGHHAIALYAEAMVLPLYRRTLEGGSLEQGKNYNFNASDEVEDLYWLLKEIKEERDVEGVSVGAILSDYQRVRVEHVCKRLGLKPLAFLWRRDQEELLEEMIACGVHSILIKVATLGLTPKHLGKTLAEIQPHMMNMQEKYGLNVCGEGGEYETFTLDCPLFKKRIVLDETELVMHSDDAIAPVAYLNLRKLHLEEKSQSPHGSLQETLASLPMKRSDQILKELFSDKEIEREKKTSVTTAPPTESSDDFCEDCRQCRLSVKPEIETRENREGWVKISGLSALNTDGSTIAEQTKHLMDKLKETLHSHKMSMSDLVAVHLHLGNMADFASVSEVYGTYFSLNPPIRVCLEVALPSNVSLQIDCIAHKDESSTEADVAPRHAMHVQGLSHWAPANFAPYSQAVKIGAKIYVAGQIALVPATMQIISGGIQPQCRLSLRSVRRILQAMSPDCHMSDITTGVCYVTARQHIEGAKAEWDRALSIGGDQEDETVLNDKPLPYMIYVVVPRLPKAALVEWQVTALSGRSMTCQSYKASCREDAHTCNVSVTTSHSEDSAMLTLSLKGDLDSATPRCTKPSAASCIKLMMTTISLVLEKANCLVEDLGSLRVFYVARDFDQEQLVLEYKKQLPRVWTAVDNCPIPAFVPVISLQQKSQILSFCH